MRCIISLAWPLQRSTTASLETQTHISFPCVSASPNNWREITPQHSYQLVNSIGMDQEELVLIRAGSGQTSYSTQGTVHHDVLPPYTDLESSNPIEISTHRAQCPAPAVREDRRIPPRHLDLVVWQSMQCSCRLHTSIAMCLTHSILLPGLPLHPIIIGQQKTR